VATGIEFGASGLAAITTFEVRAEQFRATSQDRRCGAEDIYANLPSGRPCVIESRENVPHRIRFFAGLKHC